MDRLQTKRRAAKGLVTRTMNKLKEQVDAGAEGAVLQTLIHSLKKYLANFQDISDQLGEELIEDPHAFEDVVNGAWEVEHEVQMVILKAEKAMRSQVLHLTADQKAPDHAEDTETSSEKDADEEEDLITKRFEKLLKPSKAYRRQCTNEETWIDDLIAEEDEELQYGPASMQSSVKSELPKFNGDLMEWKNFLGMFHALVHNTRKTYAEKLALLKTALGKEPAMLVKNINGGKKAYIRALTMLKERYGDAGEQRRVHREHLRKLPNVKQDDHVALQTFADEVRGVLAALEDDDGINEEDLVLEIAEKLPFSEHKEWNMYCRLHGGATMATFSTWLGDVAKATRRLAHTVAQKGKEQEVKKVRFHHFLFSDFFTRAQN